MVKLKIFILEVFLFFCFLIIGAAVFQALEEDKKTITRQYYQTESSKLLVRSAINQIRNKYNITERKLNGTVDALRSVLRKSGKEWEDWSFTGSYYFVGTVAFTIGFGRQTPKTALGQFMVILYSLIAIPTAALLLSACGEKLAKKQKCFVIFIETKLFRKTPTYIKAKNIAVNVMVLVFIFIISSLMAVYFDNGWTAMETIYFLWICYTTVGFGDYMVNDGKVSFEGEVLKTIALRLIIVLLVLGLCQVSCILVSVQDVLEEEVVNKVESIEAAVKEDTSKEDDENQDNPASVNQAFEMDVQNLGDHDK